MIAFSSSTEDTHSPPDLITSFARSTIETNPSGDTVATSPVLNQPSAVILVGSAELWYPLQTHGPRTWISPKATPSHGSSAPDSRSQMRSSTHGTGEPCVVRMSSKSPSCHERGEATVAIGDVSVM